ncbi:Fibrillarin-like rRNA/tRNA 2'-O-methyltransferase [uncultured archaeon]|nr:Fibrillarin-like rRNA/tRNA 2'-O-methyltransferase [uncultured archaeon]
MAQDTGTILPGVRYVDVVGHKRIATVTTTSKSVYGERIIHGLRIWDPYRSKLAALLLKSRSPLPIVLSINSIVLYLGASTGTTVSHVSDIVRDGLVYAVEVSPRSMRQLLPLAESRRNIIPILGDAARPESYSRLVEPVDLVYQDVAQRNQADIATLNSARYLKTGGILVLMIKTRSIDSTAAPEEIRGSEIERLLGLEVQSVTDLLPYHHDHWAVVAKKV